MNDAPVASVASGASVAILGMGLSIAPAVSMREAVTRAGGDPAAYEGWPRVCLAGEDDHPSTMGHAALMAALEDADVSPSDIRLVLAVGTSRDYLPSWSLATELMALAVLSPECVGWDMTLGCLGTIAGLEVARGWLRTNPGVVAIVAAERWSHTIRRGDVKSAALWAHGDGAGALIVGEARAGYPIWRGATFRSEPSYNAQILVKYGGTRFPTAPAGVSPFERTLGSRTRAEVFEMYARRYREVFDVLRARFDVSPKYIVCNQISPNVVSQIARLGQVSDAAVPRTGNQYGHLGSVDAIAGLVSLRDDGLLAGDILVAGSTPYAFGAGLVSAVP